MVLFSIFRIFNTFESGLSKTKEYLALSLAKEQAGSRKVHNSALILQLSLYLL